MEVYEVKKAQREAAYNKQQQEIAELKDFVARNKARVATRNIAMSRQKKLDNMDIIEKIQEKPKPEFNFKVARTPGKILLDAKTELLRALKDYKGSILMVCHEPEFYENLATQVWDCTKWTTKI